jgi:hypothetical protein
MTDVSGTERILAQINWPHKIGFRATYGFSPGSIYIMSACSTQNSNAQCSSTIQRGSLRAELAVTCTRDQTPPVTSTSMARNSEISTAVAQLGPGHTKRSSCPRAVNEEMIPSLRWRIGWSGRPIRPVDAETSSRVLPRSGVRLGVEAPQTAETLRPSVFENLARSSASDSPEADDLADFRTGAPRLTVAHPSKPSPAPCLAHILTIPITNPVFEDP